MDLNEKLKSMRLKYGMTQECVAECLGVSSQTVSKWERGVLAPDIMLLPQIAILYHCSIDSLFSMESVWDENHEKEFSQRIKELKENGDYKGLYRAWIKEIELKPDTYHYYPQVIDVVKNYKLLDEDHFKRMILLANYAEKNCSSHDILNEIFAKMVVLCSMFSRVELAKCFYAKLPKLGFDRELVAKYVMSEDEFCAQAKKNVEHLTMRLAQEIEVLIASETSESEALVYREKIVSLYELIHERKYGGFSDVHLACGYVHVIRILHYQKRYEEICPYIERCIELLNNSAAENKKENSSEFYTMEHCKRSISNIDGNLKIVYRLIQREEYFQKYRSPFEEALEKYENHYGLK